MYLYPPPFEHLRFKNSFHLLAKNSGEVAETKGGALENLGLGSSFHGPDTAESWRPERGGFYLRCWRLFLGKNASWIMEKEHIMLNFKPMNVFLGGWVFGFL